MALIILPIALGIAAVVTMIAATFLLINGRSLLRMWRGMGEPGPKVRVAQTWHTPDGHIRVALIVFLLGTLACLGVYVTAIMIAGNAA